MILSRSPILVALMVGICASAQGTDPTFTKTGSLSVETIAKKGEECAKHGLVVPQAKGPIQLYKIRYQSTDTHGVSTIVSGLLALPKSAPNGIVLYFHATIRDRELAPSRYTGSNDLLEPEYVTMAFSTGGYAVFMPDTLGLGDNEGVHPYPFAEENCTSGLDMIVPGRLAAKRLGVGIGNHLFITGYSEGGADAMCAVRRLENGHALSADMAAPMSGPYDLSGETVKSFLKGNQSPEGFGTKLFELSYSAYSSFSNLKGIDLKDYFAPSYATYIPYVFGLKLDDIGMAKRFVTKAVELGDFNSINKILTGPFRESLRSGDRANPIVAEMVKSDCFNWTPKTKMLLPYLSGDDVVSNLNTSEAIDAMRLNGVGPDRLRSFEIKEKGLSHSTAVPAALSAARRFFDGGFAGVWQNGIVEPPRFAQH